MPMRESWISTDLLTANGACAAAVQRTPAGHSDPDMPTPRRTVRFVVETDDVGLPGRVAKQLPRGSRLTILSASVRPDRSEAGALGTIPHAAREADPAPSFTGRQREIAELLVRDMSNKEIGRILGLSHFTVRNHVSQLFRILGIGARREVAGRMAEMFAGGAGSSLR